LPLSRKPMNIINNTLCLRRRSKIHLPETQGEANLPLPYIASVLKNIEALGFTFSEALIQACRQLTLDQLTTLYQSLIVDLRKAKGAHRQHNPMYPNFPAQVMEMSQCELYINAIVHYLTEGRYLPPTEAKARLPLLDNVELQIIDLGTVQDFEALFTQIVSANTSLSEQDKEDLDWYIRTYGSDIARLLPAAIPQKENMATVAGLLLQHTDNAAEFIAAFCRTATDVLRLAVSMSSGDVSLATATRFRSFSRAERNLLLGLLERQSNATEDILRWKDRWIRLGERLHPGEYAKKYPRAAEAFHILRNDIPVPTFNRQIEKTLTAKNVAESVAQLATRPGDFARRLDHLLRLDVHAQDAVAEAFGGVAERVSTPVLLQVMRHFRGRNHPSPLRVFFPKGNLAKAYAVTNTLPGIAAEVCHRIASLCEDTLLARFQKLPPLGKVYVDEALSDYMVPFASRSASKSFRTVARGSRLPLPEACKVLRFFVWWKNGTDRTDIDLSATLFDSEFCYRDIISYYNLTGYGGCHSGDIVDAPNGASEFIDISLEKVREMGSRYLVMSLNSFTEQPFCDLPECFAGWMAREEANSGEIYEPKTVQDRLDITANTCIAIPLLIDVEEKRVIWCDMALRRHPRWRNKVHNNLTGIGVTLQALANLNKPTLYELFTLHALARGELVKSVEEADTVLSVENGIPFRQEEIAAGYLA
jgi:hypothetical protein